jgi:hypothetical protein
VLGRKELAILALEKQTLVAESGLNRLAVQAELQNLRSATAWVHEATRWPHKLGPLLTLLAPLGGFLLTRVSRHPDSWLNRIVTAAKWAAPLYTLWKSFSTSGTAPEPPEPVI